MGMARSRTWISFTILIHINFLFYKGPGDFVEADEILARIETDKVTVDITAPEAGVI